MTELIGRRLGRYKIEIHIGGGGMADVYKGYDTMLRRWVAIKVPKRERSRDRAFIEAFADEAVTAANLSHEHIVTIFDTGSVGRLYYIVMEYVDGQNLRELIRARGGLALGRVCELFDQIAEALNYAHGEGFVHCDVKPSNILVAAGGQVKLTDFGIARAVARGGAGTESKRLVGTARYMSPEHVRQERLDHRSDIYSLGVVLFEMLTRRVPFDKGSSGTIRRAHVTEQPVAPSVVNRSLPKAVDGVVLRALAKDPDKRYQNALQMARDLRGAMVGVGPAPIPSWVRVIVGIAVVVLVGVATVMGLRRGDEQEASETPTATASPILTATEAPRTRTVEILLPTGTDTSPPGPTSTLLPTETAVRDTATPVPTLTRAPTRTPTPVGFKYASPIVLGPDDGAGFSDPRIPLRWSWSVELEAGEWFDLYMWRRGEAEQALQLVSRSVDMNTFSAYVPGGGGDYCWKVRIVRGEPGQPGAIPLSDWSEVRCFTYSGPAPPGPPGGPPPTRTPLF